MSFLGMLGKLGGAAGGFMLGGPAGAMAGYSLGSALGGSGGGGHRGPNPMDQAAQQYGGYASQDRNRFLDALNGGQNAVNQTTSAAVQNALPSYMQNLQSSRESAIRRGASNGDLQTSFEGDLSSAFQRNVSNAAAGQATNVLGQQLGGLGAMAQNSGNSYLDLIAGNRDAQQAKDNNKTDIWGSILGAGAQLGGAYLGRK